MSIVSDQTSTLRSRANRTGLRVVVEGEGYEGFVVIDSVVERRSAGGVRITDDLVLAEVEELAAEMSLKYSLFHLPRGGAKAGLRLDPGLDSETRAAALRDFGRRLRPLIENGIYYPGMDMNCGPDDLRTIYRGAGMGLGKITDTSFFTAVSVAHALAAAADVLAPDRPVTLAIEGFGSVARHLVERLDPDRFRVVALSTIEGGIRNEAGFELAALAAAKQQYGDRLVHELVGEAVALQDVLAADVDVLLPSSRIHVIDAQLARGLRARSIVPISNAPYAPGTLDVLRERAVQCMPGYLSNVGGVLASSLYDQGLPIAAVEELFAARYRPVVDGLLRLAAKQERLVTAVAEEIAESHMPERTAPRARSLAERIFERFLRRKMPAGWRAQRARVAFERATGAVLAEIESLERDA